MRHVFVLCLLSLLTVVFAELPEYITKCKVSDPKFNECLKEQAKKAIANIKDGDEDLGIPSLNPAKIPRLLLAPSKQFQLDLRNCNAYGIDKLRINAMKLDTKFQTLDFSVDAQNASWICTYRANGELLNESFADRGFVNITFVYYWQGAEYMVRATESIAAIVVVKISLNHAHVYVNCSAQYIADYQSTENNETSYYLVKNDVVLMNIDQITFNLTHADGSADDQAIQLNKILNEEYEDLKKEFIPSIKIISSRLITRVVNKIFRSSVVDQLFDS